MTKSERFGKAVNYLRMQGMVANNEDIAIKMGADPSNVSRSVKGTGGYPSDSFLRRFNTAFDNIFNSDWLLAGEGEMLVHHVNQSVNGDNNTQIAGNNNRIALPSTLDRAINEIAEQRKLVSKAQEQIDRLITLLENK